MSLEQSLEFIDEDEFVEVTPSAVRIRKKLLKEYERKELTDFSACLFSINLATTTPISNNTQAGMAKRSWEIISGGVNIIPSTKQPMIKYGRFRANAVEVVIPEDTNNEVAIGISKANPNAKNIFIMKSKY